ncbi:MAG: hypothetical protein R2827_08120 [Bdellovibrionales bacterium]
MNANSNRLITLQALVDYTEEKMEKLAKYMLKDEKIIVTYGVNGHSRMVECCMQRANEFVRAGPTLKTFMTLSIKWSTK